MQGPIAVVTFNRPPANALNQELFAELLALCPRLHQPEVRGVVLTGQGTFFSAGLTCLRYSGNEAQRLPTSPATSMTAWPGCSPSLPVVAVINGHAIAGGASAGGDRRLPPGRRRQAARLTEIQVGVPFPARRAGVRPPQLRRSAAPRAVLPRPHLRAGGEPAAVRLPTRSAQAAS